MLMGLTMRVRCGASNHETNMETETTIQSGGSPSPSAAGYAYPDLTPTQQKVLRISVKTYRQFHNPYPRAGSGMAPLLSAARSLVRKGLMKAGHRTGTYWPTTEGEALWDRYNEKKLSDR
jgi:hypothetical protein